MWQLLLGAALAGSTSLVAKHLFSPNADRTPNQPQTEKTEQENLQNSIGSSFESPVVRNECNCNESGYESNYEQQEEGIFRFSSFGSSGKKKIRNFKKKSGIVCRRLKYDSVEKRSGGLEGSGKRFAVCLKKRKTTRTVPAKCGSCSSKNSSLFDWGLGVGIMYMMSTGKAEISKLSTAMDETSKVVQELRTELYKRISAQAAAGSKTISGDHSQLVYNRSSTRDGEPSDIKMRGLPRIDDVECPSSVITEEPEPDPEVLEMEQLEAELESELQKLPWCTADTSGHEVTRPNLGKSMVSSKGFHEPEEQNPVSYQCQGVLPSELNQKLCHLLIEQQGNQIVELESELHLAQSKLHEKEAELQALKDCVKRLNEFSLSTVSDDEAEVQVGQECTSEWDNNIKVGSGSRKSVVGMKRPIDSE